MYRNNPITDARQFVSEMAIDAGAGRSPEPLMRYLREQFPDLKVPLRSGPPSYEVDRVEPFDDGGFLRASCVFWAYTRDPLLEATVLPSSGTCGLFAVTPHGVSYLHRRRGALEGLLREENRPLDQCAPRVIAWLVAEVVGRARNDSHDIVISLDAVTLYDGTSFGAREGYEADARELRRLRAAIAAPAISTLPDGGWELAFCSVFGWMHDKQQLVAHHVRFDTEFRITHEQQVLSRKIFKRVPGVRY